MRLPLVTIALVALAAGPAARLHAQQDTTVKWYDRLRFEGDMRVRFDYLGLDETDRGRVRIRLRTGFTLPIAKTVTAGVRVATAEVGSVTSTNISLSGAFTLKNFGIERAYISWAPSPRFTVTGGKFQLPLIKPAGVFRTEMVYDEDVAPEGFHEQLNLVLNKEGVLRRLAVLGEQWTINEVGDGPDTWMLGGQLAADLAFSSRVSGTITGGYFTYAHGKTLAAARNTNSALFVSNGVVLRDGTVLEGGKSLAPPTGNPFATFVNDFNLLNGNAGITVDQVFGRQPLNLYLDVVHNTGAESENTGYWAGITAGALRRRGDWTATVVYSRLETEATLSIYNYSDMGFGGTNNQGPIFQVQYRPGNNFTLSARHHIMSAINEATGVSTKPIHRLLLDAGVAF
jgi:hypothetical protein